MSLYFGELDLTFGMKGTDGKTAYEYAKEAGYTGSEEEFAEKLAKNYASSATDGGSATSAVKLDSSAGSELQPIYFKDGKPVATTYTLNKSVPTDAKFTDTIYTHPTYPAKTGVPTANQKPRHGESFTVTQPVSDESGHIIAMNSRTITLPNETQLNKSIDAPHDTNSPLSFGESFGAMQDFEVDNHNIARVFQTFTLPSETQLSKTNSGNGNAITDIEVNGHNISITKGKTFSESGHKHTKSEITDFPTSMKNPSALKVGEKTYDGSSEIIITASDLGLASAMKFLGTSTTAITDGSKTKTITVSGSSVTVTSGNVVLYGSKEFVWNGSSWEELGNEGSYKVVQEAVSSPSASGNATAFIDTISQDTNGKITVTKKNVSFPSLSGGTASTNDSTVTGGVTVNGHAVTVAKKTLVAGDNVTITGGTNNITISSKDTTYDIATADVNGLMSAIDKLKLDGIDFTTWTGTKAEYDAIAKKDEKCLYITIDDNEEPIYELTSNKVTVLNDSATNEQYPSALAVWNILSNLNQYEQIKNKVTSLDANSTDEQYPTAKAVYEGAFSVANKVAEEAEKIANKVTSISSSSTDNQYPSAKAVNTLVNSTKTNILNTVGEKVTSISGSSTDNQYPTAKAVNDVITTKVDAVIPELEQSINEGVANVVRTTQDATMNARFIAQSNSDYEIAQVRNVIISTNNADASKMNDGDIWIKI